MPERRLLNFIGVGDIGFVGKVSDNIKIFGPKHPFKYVEQILSRGDIVFGNLEKPFTENQRPIFNYLSTRSIANPKGVDSLAHGHFNIVSLANNHILDFGIEGLAYTMKLLDGKGIKYVGAGFNLDEARRPVIIEKKGIRIGFLAYASKSENMAAKDKPGAAPLDYQIVISDIFEIRQRVDFVVVSLHFGLMYVDYPTKEDREIARSIAAEGANLIIGHHPHVIQGIERYRDGTILFSLGEFIFDSTVGNIHVPWIESKRKESLIFSASFSTESITGVKVYPIILNENYQPSIPQGDVQEKIIKRFEKISEMLHTQSIRELNEHLGARLVRHNVQVLVFHLKKCNFAYLFKKIFRLRLRHIRYFTGFLLRNLKSSTG